MKEKRITKKYDNRYDTNCENCQRHGQCVTAEDCIEVLCERLAQFENAEEARCALKSCPFCGGEAMYDYVASGKPLREFTSIKCKTCGAGTKIYQNIDQYGNDCCGELNAESAWNRRVGQEPK